MARDWLCWKTGLPSLLSNSVAFLYNRAETNWLNSARLIRDVIAMLLQLLAHNALFPDKYTTCPFICQHWSLLWIWRSMATYFQAKSKIFFDRAAGEHPHFFTRKYLTRKFSDLPLKQLFARNESSFHVFWFLLMRRSDWLPFGSRLKIAIIKYLLLWSLSPHKQAALPIETNHFLVNHWIHC